MDSLFVVMFSNLHVKQGCKIYDGVKSTLKMREQVSWHKKKNKKKKKQPLIHPINY